MQQKLPIISKNVSNESCPKLNSVQESGWNVVVQNTIDTFWYR